jgi:hypothetical protein
MKTIDSSSQETWVHDVDGGVLEKKIMGFLMQRVDEVFRAGALVGDWVPLRSSDARS